MKDTVNRVKYQDGYAYLFTDFGEQLAIKKTGLTIEQLEALVGRFKKGKNKGKLKGTLTWCKITGGGWVKTGRYDFEEMKANGFVCTKVGFCFAFGIHIAPFRGMPEHKWGFDRFEQDPIDVLAHDLFHSEKPNHAVSG